MSLKFTVIDARFKEGDLLTIGKGDWPFIVEKVNSATSVEVRQILWRESLRWLLGRYYYRLRSWLGL